MRQKTLWDLEEVRQRFFPYTQWEDWKSGMYRNAEKSEEDRLACEAVAILGERSAAEKSMARVIREWPVSSAVNLSDRTKNRRPWLGQSACCIVAGVPDYITKRAWWELTESQRCEANAAADSAIKAWEIENA